MNNPYDPVDQTGIVVDGLDIGSVVSEIRDKGYCVENFLTTEEVEQLRANFNESVPITEMRAIGNVKLGERGGRTTCWVRPVRLITYSWTLVYAPSLME